MIFSLRGDWDFFPLLALTPATVSLTVKVLRDRVACSSSANQGAGGPWEMTGERCYKVTHSSGNKHTSRWPYRTFLQCLRIKCYLCLCNRKLCHCDTICFLPLTFPGHIWVCRGLQETCLGWVPTPGMLSNLAWGNPTYP